MKIFVLLFLLFGTFSSAQDNTLRATPYKYVKDSIGKGKPHFLELGSDSCNSCQIMGRSLYRFKQNNPTYNIEFINVKEQREAAYEFKIRMIPTQIIFDAQGKEVYRHIGLLTDKQLQELFRTYKF